MSKLRDYTTSNYCDFLWIGDLLELKRNERKEFTLELQRGQRTIMCNIINVIIFGTIVEVKEVGYKGVLYQVDDGTGVIACKHTLDQFQEMLGVIENEMSDILNQTVDVHQALEQSSMVDTSADDSIFNDKSMQVEDINFQKKNELRGLQSMWDDIYKSFSNCITTYASGDSVLIEGKLYTYYNMNQIYINCIRKVDIAEEIMLTSVKLEDGLDEKRAASKTKPEGEKRLSGLITFDNIPHLNPKFSVPVIETPQLNDEMLNGKPEIVTPNLDPTITFDTFTFTSPS